MPATVALYAFGGWTLLVWGTRIDNILAEDPWSGLDLAVAVVMVALGVAVLAVAALRRRLDDGLVVPVVGAAAATTLVVWAVRVPLMLGAGHAVGFVVVHTALAVVSVALAVVAWRAVRPAGTRVVTSRRLRAAGR